MSKRLKPDQKQVFHSLAKDFHELVTNKQVLRPLLENFFNNLVDEMTLGIIFDLHRKYKTNSYDVDVDDSVEEEDTNDVDVFAQQNLKKTQDCMCPNCDRAVAAVRFAPHLEACMGMGRISRSRNASRRVVSNSKDRGDCSSYSGIPSDDEDDVDWNSGDRKRSKKKDRNGSKKSRGTPKKLLELESVEQLNVDVEGEDDELTNLRDILHLQDYSNSTSPADSASSSGSTKKKDKSKKKSSKQKDRVSPSSTASAD